MNYYQCSLDELRLEAQRRHLVSCGRHDQLSEALQKDDDRRGTVATTLITDQWSPYLTSDTNQKRTAEFGNTAPISLLVNERIVYWSMNTFFPTLQLFFESGLSCTIDGSSLSGAAVGLDALLRFRLTDCTHEEDGRLVKTMRPDKFTRSDTGIAIKDAVMAQRTSIAVRPCDDRVGAVSQSGSTLESEIHEVIGLRLEGMHQMAYVYAKAQASAGSENRTWGTVRLAGLREDVPFPSVVFPLRSMKPGEEVMTVSKESHITVSKMTLVMR